MDDRIRVSDADRDRVAARLREHYAAGRLSFEEMEERIAAALGAKTAGDLSRVLTDLPEPAPVLPRAWDQGPGRSWDEPRARPGPAAGPAGPGGPGGPGLQGLPHRLPYRRGPRLLPLALAALVIAVMLPAAGWAFFALANLVMLLFLTACLAGIFMALRFRRRVRRALQSGYGCQWYQCQWRP